jgi:hypothetical protein
MENELISHRLQGDILRALSVFHPYAPTGKQYFNCFGERDEFQMVINVMSLVAKGLVSRRAVIDVKGCATLSLCHLKLTQKGFSYALTH